MEDDKSKINNTDNDLKNIHTYLSDMAETVKQKDASVIKINLAEKKKKEIEENYLDANDNSQRSNIFYLVGSIIIIIIAIIAIFVVINNKKTAIPIEEVSTTENQTILKYEQKSSFDVISSTSKNDLIKFINEEVDKTENLGQIKAIFLNKLESDKKGPLPLEDFLSLSQLPAPPSLMRSFSGSYMVGIYSELNNIEVPKTKHLFLIFNLNNHDLAYASMLDWEKTLFNDLSDMFDIKSSDRLINKSWKDIFINNKDVRVLYNDAGEGLLYYMFISNNIIITDDQKAINEIGERFTI